MKDFEQRLASVAEKVNHLDAVELRTLTASTHELSLRVNHLDVVEARALHRQTLELRQDFQRLQEATRSMLEYSEVRADNIYANLGRLLGSSS